MNKKKLFKNIAVVIAALIIAAAGFGLGFLVKDCTQNKYVSSYEWVIGKIKSYYYYEVNEDDVYKVGLSNLRGTVLDAYSRYYTPEEYKIQLASTYGSQSGIGVSFGYVEGEKSGVIIERVVGNSPAYRSGLRAGTLITGASCGDLSVTFTSRSDFISFVNARNTGEEMTLLTDRGNFVLAKEEYRSSYCAMSTNSKAWEIAYDGDGSMQVVSASERVMSFLPDDTAYLSLSEFYGNAAGEMAELITRFNAEECKTLILDLRNNGGGSVDVLRDISGLFTGKIEGASDVALSVRYKNGKEETGKVIKRASENCILPADAKIFVLANCNTASASEALIGVLVSNGIVPYENIYISDFSKEYLEWSGNTAKNCRTYGKGIMQTTYANYITGEAICLTTAVVYWPNGRTIHGVGISPEDGCKTVHAEWSATYYDEELQAAVTDIASRIYGGQ
ncbi:MAG: S41 family peptidase [Candidatus Coproplasma sp.]